MTGIIWFPGGLRDAAAHLGHTLTVRHCQIWASAFKANHPGFIAYNVGAASCGNIAVQGREPNGQVLTILAPVMA